MYEAIDRECNASGTVCEQRLRRRDWQTEAAGSVCTEQ